MILKAFLSHVQVQADLIQAQRELISRLRRDIQYVDLQHTKTGRDLVEQFLITLEHPELHDEAREGLLRARMEFTDQVARLEEMTA